MKSTLIGIQALLDKNPTASRQELGPHIRAIRDETHRKIYALLTDHQKEVAIAVRNHGLTRLKTKLGAIEPYRDDVGSNDPRSETRATSG